MEISKVEVGYLEENCYLIKKDNNGIIVDPGDEIDKILEMIKDTKILGVLITHAHFDHVGALDELLKKYDVPVYYHNVNKELNYETLVDVEEKDYSLNNINFKVIYTPGHRNDSITYYFYEEDIMFTGDFLFYQSIGRTDLKYGNDLEMKDSLKKIKTYDDDITIYPGHGIRTNLGFEKENNMYLK